MNKQKWNGSKIFSNNIRKNKEQNYKQNLGKYIFSKRINQETADSMSTVQ